MINHFKVDSMNRMDRRHPRLFESAKRFRVHLLGNFRTDLTAAACSVKWPKAMTASLVFALGGCTSLSPLAGPSQDFVAAANVLAQAESDYFDEIQAASDAAYRMQASEDYVGHIGNFGAVADKLFS